MRWKGEEKREIKAKGYSTKIKKGQEKNETATGIYNEFKAKASLAGFLIHVEK